MTAIYKLGRRAPQHHDPSSSSSSCPSSMAFSGKYEFESDKNYDEFMKRLGE